MMLSRDDEDRLVQLAFEALENAYAPYSGFSVGAAILAQDGRTFTGCNVENASFGLSICAERNAVAAAVAAGARQFTAIAIVTSGAASASPCGACRQVLAEFGDFAVIQAGANGVSERTSVAELLPRAFSRTDLMKG